MRRLQQLAAITGMSGLLWLGAVSCTRADAPGPEILVFLFLALCILEASIILIEAQAYQKKAGLPESQAMNTSLVANLSSVVLGTFLLCFLNPWYIAAVILYAVSGLLVTELIEVPVVIAMNRGQVAARVSRVILSARVSREVGYEQGHVLFKTAVLVNLGTYVLHMLLYVLGIVLVHIIW